MIPTTLSQGPEFDADHPPVFDFAKAVREFNALYGLPINNSPTMLFTNRTHFVERMEQLKKILTDEVSEVDLLIEKAQAGATPTEVLTELADWLGDLQVYCASEMLKFGLDNQTVLSIIMASNMSKLGEDGKVILENGKVMKGPRYWKPEEQISRYIKSAARQALKGEAS